MYRVNGFDIDLTRGDSFALQLRLSGRDLPTDTQAILTVRKYLYDEAVLRKHCAVYGGVAHVAFLPEETNLPVGHYWWDVRVLIPDENGDEVFTPIEPAALNILPAVGWDVRDDG